MSRQSQFAARIYQAGLNIGLPDHLARLAATQASLETGYGKSVKGNNYFGIKAGKSWGGDTQTFTTHEEYGGKRVKIRDQFRKYATPEDSIKDWAALMQRAYPDTWNSANLDGAINGLQNGKYGPYATDSKYSNKLNYINRNFLSEQSYPSVALNQLPPMRAQEPTTALAAIEEVAPSVPDKPQRLAYAQEPTVKPNKFSSAGEGVQKVASAIGNSLIDTGQSIYDAGRNTVSGMVDALQPDEPKKTYRKATAADLWRLGVARPTNHMTPTGEQAPIKTPTAAVAELSAPAPIAPTQGLQDQKKNPLQQAQASVSQMLAPIMNVRHDIGGQFDGMRLGAADTVQGMLQNAFDRPSYNVSPDQALASGAFLQPNGYYYTGNKQDGFTQVGKQQGDVAKMWADTRKKPKGYTYFDQVAGEWKDV